jgi:hydroxyacid-oxoacid transhydrogenase
LIKIYNDGVSMIPLDNIFYMRFVPIKFGLGAVSEIGYDLKEFNTRRVLIVTDNFLYKQTKIVDQVVEYIRHVNIEVDVWDGVEPEPSEESIIEGIRYASGKNFDAYVGLGGGSSLDTAKLIDLYTTYPTDNFRDYFVPPIGRGKSIPGPIKPLIAVPTTAGTGSEVTGVAIVTFKTDKGVTKFGLSHKYLVPNLAILDPLLTMDLPPNVTATTGMDAFMHAVEAYTSKPYNTREKPEDPTKRPVYQGSNMITDALAERAIHLIGKYLIKAYANGRDLEARTNMLLAAHMAGIAFANAGVHIPHALSYPIAGITYERKNLKVPHGVAVTLPAPATFKIICRYIPEKCMKIAELLKDFIPESVIKPESVATAIINMMKLLNLPNGLSELGITEEDVNRIAEETLIQKRLLAQSPVAVTKELLIKILRDSLKYW